MTRTLDVYLHDQKAGHLIQDEDGGLSFTYADAYLTLADAPAISVAMPLHNAPYADKIAKSYFSGLLPDEQARQRLASALGISEGNTFGLLNIIGGECAGALSLLPEGEMPPEQNQQSLEPLTEKKLAQILDLLRAKPLLGGEEDIRLSLAGAQDKLAVCLADGGIALAKNGRPTTHILKPFIEGLDGTVENEVFCMKLAAKIGLVAPPVTKGSAGETDFILVERYDRIEEETGTILRLHQEDFCQALSVPPELKYEDEGGPGILQSQNLIQKYTRHPAADRLAFQRMVIFHYLIGNADAHAKNYALLYTDGVPDLAPLYDVVCTAAYPRLAKKMALKIGGRGIADTIQLAHWQSIVHDTRAAQRFLSKELQEFATSVRPHADELLKELEADGVAHPVLKRVRAIIETRATHILRILENQKARG